MSRYLLVYHGGSMPESEAETAEVMKAWDDWMASLGPAMVDPGNPVGAWSTISADGQVKKGGGANPASGYSILEVDSLDKAVQMAGSCPVLRGGASVEVAETFNVM